MTWFLILDLDEWQSSWPADYRGSRVRLENRASAAQDGLPHNLRLSPVFPLREPDAQARFLATNCDWYIDFFCPEDPFRQLGRITQLEADVQRHVWFSVGSAAILSITTQPHFGSELHELVGGAPVAHERWVVASGRLQNTTVHRPPAGVGLPSTPELPEYGALPTDVRGVVDDFVVSARILEAPLATLLPTEASTYRTLAEDVSEVVEELLFLTNPTGAEAPIGLRDQDIALLRNSQPHRAKLIHQRTDRLVQINSALAYVTSQLHSGSPPILERRCLVRRYSLLGIGSAIKALVRLARHVEAAFSAGRIEGILAEVMAAPTSQPLPGIRHANGHDASGWEEFGVGDLARLAPAWRSPAKIAYFSGRLGFRETEYAISAALQVLWAGDSIEWSPNTLTHELLHGHVRNILAQIFGSPEGGRADSSWQLIYDRFASSFEGNDPVDMTTLDSIRYLLLSYCCAVPTWGSLTSPPSEPFIDAQRSTSEVLDGDVLLYDPVALWSILEHQQRSISEIFVHVLDLHYFYRSSLRAYVPFLWQSWAAIPVVARDLRQYVLRTLLAVASTEGGAPQDRLSASIRRIQEVFSQAPPASGPYSLVSEVLAYLQNQSAVDYLYYPFHAALRIVDLARWTLFSKEIRGALWAADPLVELEEAGDGGARLRYNLADLEFADVGMASPTAFLLDRLQRALLDGTPLVASEQKAAWVLLALTGHSEVPP